MTDHSIPARKKFSIVPSRPSWRPSWRPFWSTDAREFFLHAAVASDTDTCGDGRPGTASYMNTIRAGRAHSDSR